MIYTIYNIYKKERNIRKNKKYFQHKEYLTFTQ